MDQNIVVVAGRLATEPELRVFESGARLLRFLVTVKAEEPKRRVDVIPVTLWDPDDDLVTAQWQSGQAVFAVGSVQRRFWDVSNERRSRIEIVARYVRAGDEEQAPQNEGSPILSG